MKIQMILLVLTTLVLASCATDINIPLENNSERPEVCPAIYDPVCGSDGRTYGNSCEAARDGVTEYTAGECNAEELEPVICPAIYAPVCGADGVTYGNECMLNGAKVELAYEGECNAESEEPVICPAIYDPVCGTNGRTYSNSCVLNGAKVELAYEGECNAEPQLGSIVVCTPEQKAAEICTREYMPVCGNDGRTYGNKCEACAGNADNYTVGECA